MNGDRDYEAPNIHCSVVEIDGTGILIEGEPGSGKTSLAFALVEAARARGGEGCFVCDDQAVLNRDGRSIIARACPAIEGKAELRGFGIVSVANKPYSKLGLVARLRPEKAIERLPEKKFVQVLDVQLPMLELPSGHEAQCVRIVRAWLAGAGPVI